MFHRSSMVMIPAALAAAIAIPVGDIRAADEAKYPNWTGQWERFIGPGLPGRNGSSHDHTRSPAYGQQAPLTPK